MAFISRTKKGKEELPTQQAHYVLIFQHTQTSCCKKLINLLQLQKMASEYVNPASSHGLVNIKFSTHEFVQSRICLEKPSSCPDNLGWASVARVEGRPKCPNPKLIAQQQNATLTLLSFLLQPNPTQPSLLDRWVNERILILSGALKNPISAAVLPCRR